MNTVRTEIAIIGAGTAGLNARREADKAGKTHVLIEGGPYGTTCARVGCMPSKLLIAAADAAHEVASAGTFGVRVPATWSVDGKAVMARVRAERDRFAGLVVESTEALPAANRLRGHARFVDAQTLQVDDHTRVEAQAIVIATGSSPVIPPPYDRLRRHLLVNDDLFALDDLPRSVAVVGTGIIGLELGQALHRLRVEVTFFSPSDALGPLTDPTLKESAHAVFADGLDLQLRSQVNAISEDEGGVTIDWTDAEGAARTRRFAKVLVAAGRRPNVGGLDLARAGIPLGERGQPLFDPRTGQCGDTPVFIAGDASGHIPLLHEASDEGRIAGANAARYPRVTAQVRRTPLAVVFTDPQMAMVGTPHAALEAGQVEIGEARFDDQGRARVMARNRGVVRLYARRQCCTLIGAELFGPRAEHMAHLLAWAVQQRMTVQQALAMPFYHPVLEEGLRTALRDLADRLKVTGSCPPQDFALAPGA